MLRREHSDFAWFKQRTSNIQSQDPSSHSTMASVSAPLNAEPTNAFERDAIDLPPKSYADAAKEPPGAEAELQSQPVPSSSSSVTAVDPNEVNYRRSSDDAKELHERQIGASGDGNLTSVKMEHNSGHAPRHDLPLISKDRKTGSQAMKRKESGQAPLASGRTAGAGWHRSA